MTEEQDIYVLAPGILEVHQLERLRAAAQRVVDQHDAIYSTSKSRQKAIIVLRNVLRDLSTEG